MQLIRQNGKRRFSNQRSQSREVHPYRSFSYKTAFLNSLTLPPPSFIFPQAEDLLNPVRNYSPPGEWKHWPCEICKDSETGEGYTVLGGRREWDAHLKSRKHKASQKRMKRQADWENWKASQGSAPASTGSQLFDLPPRSKDGDARYPGGRSEQLIS